MAKCRVCKQEEAIWAMQYIGEDVPTFSRIGSHYRGFGVVKLCDNCKKAILVECPTQVEPEVAP